MLVSRKKLEYTQKQEIKKFLNKYSIVIIGYADDAKGVNLDYLLLLWLDGDFNDSYPFAADHFRVFTAEEKDTYGGCIQHMLWDFVGFSHVKLWSSGEWINEAELQKIRDEVEKEFWGSDIGEVEEVLIEA